ncbi:MAG: hypothetical protein L3J07_03645 [Candidatus Magasanikbacteria bacterium]|nr:hypothetical protein [Candidatus Magasanikbacteria bacterium]
MKILENEKHIDEINEGREPVWIIIVSVGLAFLVSLLVMLSLIIFQKPAVTEVDIEQIQIQLDDLNEKVSFLMSENTNVRTSDKTNLSVCGNFPSHSGEDSISSSYFVCRDVIVGFCYYKNSYFEPIANCDTEVGTNPYGNPTCFKSVVDIFDFNGEIQERGTDANTKEQDVCGLTTRSYFESKMK